MLKRFYRGLGIIDIAIIAMLMVALVSVIYWRYDDFACRSMQSEAKFSLAQVHAAQKLYLSEHDHYASLETLLNDEKRVVLPQKYYSFRETAQATKDTFKIIAEGKEGTLVAGDLWFIDHNKNIINQNESCGK